MRGGGADQWLTDNRVRRQRGAGSDDAQWWHHGPIRGQCPTCSPAKSVVTLERTADRRRVCWRLFWKPVPGTSTTPGRQFRGHLEPAELVAVRSALQMPASMQIGRGQLSALSQRAAWTWTARGKCSSSSTLR